MVPTYLLPAKCSDLYTTC